MRSLIRTALSAACILTAFAVTPARAEDKPKVFFLTQSKGFIHNVVKRPAPGELSLSEKTLTEIGKQSGEFDVECSQDVAELTPEKLKGVKVVAFYTTGDLPFAPGGLDAFVDWIKQGGSFLGIHPATDTFHQTPAYYQMIGGTFDGHPWNSKTPITLDLIEDANPAIKVYQNKKSFEEEIYQHKNFDATQVRVLMALDMEKTQLKRPRFVPITWVKSFGQGKVFYTSLGHNEATWNSPEYQQHLLVAMQWLLGKTQMDTTPNPDVAKEKEAIAKKVAATRPATAK